MLGALIPGKTVAAAQKTYTIGTDVTFAPFEFANQDNKYVGIDLDLIKAIAKEEGFKVEIKPLGFNAAVQALEAKQIDGVIAGMSITPERKQKFLMSDPYYKSGVVMAVAKKSKIKSLKDLRGKRVAIKTGTDSADYANSIKQKYGFTTVTFDDSNNMYQDVITGNSAACFEDQPVMQYGINNGMALKLVGKPAREGSYGFAASKNNQALISKFNTGLKKLRANGQYDKIIEHYLGNGSAESQKTAADRKSVV